LTPLPPVAFGNGVPNGSPGSRLASCVLMVLLLLLRLLP
jgi:hypothetical protein